MLLSGAIIGLPSPAVVVRKNGLNMLYFRTSTLGLKLCVGLDLGEAEFKPVQLATGIFGNQKPVSGLPDKCVNGGICHKDHTWRPIGACWIPDADSVVF